MTATLRKGHLPNFFNELNEAHDAEGYGRILGCRDEKEERSFIRWRKRGEPAIKIPTKLINVFVGRDPWKIQSSK